MHKIYLLDDPLSAVDAHVGKSLFSMIHDGSLKGKTRILVTHQSQYLPKCDYIYVMEDGCIKACGTYEELLSKNLIQQEKEMDDEDKAKEASPSQVKPTLLSNIPDAIGDRRKTVNPTARISKDAQSEADGKLVDDETRDQGAVKWPVVKSYLVASRALPLTCVVLALSCEQAAKLISDSWLAVWSSGEGFGMDSTDEQPVEFFIGIYLATGLSQAVFVYIRTLGLLGFVCMNASRQLHNSMLQSVLRAPVSFF